MKTISYLLKTPLAYQSLTTGIMYICECYLINLFMQTHHLQLVMYEGGPSVMQNKVFNGGAASQAITDKAIAFNKDSHVEQPITDVMNLWYKTVTQDASNKYPGGYL